MDKQKKIHSLYHDIAKRYAKESHCVYFKVAALAVRNGRIIATGINGSPSGYTNCDEINKDATREQHHEWTKKYEVHAEVALVAESVRNGTSLKDCDIYITLEPCSDCCKLLASIKPRAVFYFSEYDKGCDESIQLLRDCGIIAEKV